MQFTITLIDIGPKVHTPVAGKDGYDSIEVAFRKDGKIEGKKLISFAAPEAYKAIQQFKAGDNVTVTAEKKPGRDGKEYWNWTALTAASGDSVSGEQRPSDGNGFVGGSKGNTTPAGRVTGSNYETSEERKLRRDWEVKKQGYISKQACLNTAMAFLGLTKEKPTEDRAIEVAAKFEKYIYSADAVKAIADMDDDIPV